ncbi:MAG: DHA2 family efflux MFS transporter permease subunit [Paenibacillaceae bacterium]|nr:DHA2 family efflux MFS transporter permease subunit [Paenibacillaceae bacterium]
MDTSPVPPNRLFGPLFTVIIGVFMVVLDSTAMNVAISALIDAFSSDIPTVQWTITAYMLAQATVIPLAGWLSDRFGAKRMFMMSLVLFVLASVLCALSTTVVWLICTRIIQGLGGGMLTPISMAMIYRLSPPEKVGQIMGIVGLPILIAPAVGPIVAGYFVDECSWHWIFLLNIPVGILAFVLAWRILPTLPQKATEPLDRFGIMLAPLAFAALVFGISEGGIDWTSVATIGGIAIGICALIAFIWVELRVKTPPLLELRVFRSPQFSRAVCTQWFMQFVMFGVIFLIPYFMQRAMGSTALEAGLWTLPQALAAAVCMPIGGRLYDKIGVRPLIVLGLSAVCIGVVALTRITPTDDVTAFLFPRIMFGIGMGLSFISINTYLMQSCPHHLVSRVTSLTGAMQQVFSSLSIAVVSTMITHITANNTALGLLPQSAFVNAFHATYWLIFWVAAAGIALGLTLPRIVRTPPRA